jgi:hypothetical protein
MDCIREADMSSRSAVLIFVCLVGCSPTPRYPPTAQPVIGTIYDEEELTISGTDQEVELFVVRPARQHMVRVSIPQGAYPKGTQVTFRMVAHLGIYSSPPPQLASFIFADDHNGPLDDLALQVLPADVVPAQPLTVAVKGSGRPWGLDLLHAVETDPKWEIVESGLFALPAPDEPDQLILRFNIGMPGLWTVALPEIPQLQGRLERKELVCRSLKVENPAPATLDLKGTRYVQTRQDPLGCTVTTAGTFTFKTTWEIYIQGSDHNDTAEYDFDVVDGRITGIWLKFWELDECQQQGTGDFSDLYDKEHYVLLPGSQDLPSPVVGTVCPAGVSRDAGHD